MHLVHALSRSGTPRLALAVFALGAPAVLHAQDSFPAVDPYTKNDEDARTKAGYQSFGPFRFGDDHTTDQIVTTLKGVPLLFVETEHFKLGSGLKEIPVASDAREKQHLKAELERLDELLPSIKTRIKTLDPWLRLHLYARRLEDLYASFLKDFQLQEADFPIVPPDPASDEASMGEGRFLGMPAKFTVLLFARKNDLARYASVFLGQTIETRARWHMPVTGSLLYLTAEDLLEGDYANDSALACEVLGGVAQNLALGFRGPNVGLPFAITEGLAHCYARRFDERYPFFSGAEPSRKRTPDDSAWGPSVRERVEHNVFPKLDDLLGWTAADDLGWAEHQMLWARMDWVLQREDGLAGRLLRRLKEPLSERDAELDGEKLTLRAKQSYLEASGQDLPALDTAWSNWVLETYPRK